MKAIRDLEAPKNVPELHRVMGMIKYLGKFILNLATEMHPMSHQLKSGSVLAWGPPQQKAFDKIKGIISSPTVLAFYDPKKPTVMCADASRYGIGGVLMPEHYGQLRFVQEH